MHILVGSYFVLTYRDLIYRALLLYITRMTAWSNLGKSEEKGGPGDDVHKRLHPEPQFHGQSPPTEFSQAEGNAPSAQEQDSPHIRTQLHFKSWSSRQKLCTRSYFQVYSYQNFLVQTVGCKYRLKRPFWTLRRPDHCLLFLNIRTTLLICATWRAGTETR